MIRALFLSLEQLSDPVVQRLVLRCVLLALGVFVGLVVAVGLGLAALDVTGIVWLDAALGFAGSGVTVLLAWLLFPATVILTVNLFAEQVAGTVERRHYPGLPPAPGASVSDSFQATAKLAAAGIVLNLLALPLYFLPGPNVLIYLALNGYLLGREYFETVAGRRLGLRAVGEMRRRIRFRIWISGALIAMMLAIPVFNLVAPVIATAFMTHMFVTWRRQAPVPARVPPTESGA